MGWKKLASGPCESIYEADDKILNITFLQKSSFFFLFFKDNVFTITF